MPRVSWKKEMSNIVSIHEANEENNKILKDVKEECQVLRNENKVLKEKVNFEAVAIKDLPSLLIGDSHIKDVDASNLIDTHVKSIPRAEVSDIMRVLDDTSKRRFQDIILNAGTTDCSSSDFKIQEVT